MKSFLERFEEICREHQQTNGVKSFAFIFYDFHNDDIKSILRDRGVFAKVDRLSGEKLSIFYLHSSSSDGVRRFNEAFTSTLGLGEDITLPCVVFFKLADAGFTDVAVARMDSTDLIHGFQELYGIIERYVANDKNEPEGGLRFVRWMKGATRLYLLRWCVAQLGPLLARSILNGVVGCSRRESAKFNNFCSSA